MSDEQLQDRKRAIVQKLQSARSSLSALAARLEAEQWELPVYADGQNWRASDVLRHMAEAERGMTRLIEVIRQGGEGVPANFDLNRYNSRAVEKSQDRPVGQLLEGMAQNRAGLLALLEALSAADLERIGRHGSLRMLTISQILELIAEHERDHTADIIRAVEPARSP
jgi:hypothetical protein